MGEVKRILVTGERERANYPAVDARGRTLAWKEIPVLKFEKLPVGAAAESLLQEKPLDWIIFTSSRTVEFWSALLLEHEIEFPCETKVACIGEQTARAAERDGFTPDFFPSVAGTEKFLEEFTEVLKPGSRILLPMAEGGRKTVAETLSAAGHDVVRLALYRTIPVDEPPSLSPAEIAASDLILFTSPSSYDAFKRWFEIPNHLTVGAMGQFTQAHLAARGEKNARALPESEFANVGELLC